MKAWLLIPFLYALAAHAAPVEHVGDYVKYQVTGPGLNYQKKATVLQYDPHRRAYLVETAMTADDRDPDVSRDWIPATEIYTAERGRQDVVDCEKFPGRQETFLLNGTLYPVCRHYFSNTYAYELVGPFPIFGRARLFGDDDSAAVEELVDFGWARN